MFLRWVSTVRGLRDRYLLVKDKNECEELDSMLHGQRGRPTLLGEYDHIIQKYVEDQVKAGKKVTSFMAIATAKKVLTVHDPGLLAENGGKVSLNSTWAKSFLKRVKRSCKEDDQGD